MAVGFILIWSVMGAWFALLGITSIVFLLVFLKISPFRITTGTSERSVSETPITKRMREVEGYVEMGFVKKNTLSQRKIFDSLASGFANKVKDRLKMGNDEFKEFLASRERLRATLADPQLVQLLLGYVKPDKNNWNLKRLGELISRVEDWGK